MATAQHKVNMQQQQNAQQMNQSFGSNRQLSSRAGTPGADAYRSRTEEKAALQGLNNRLAEYIERVRTLENDNEVLSVKVRELSNIDTSHYERQIDTLQAKVDDLLRKLNECQQERDRLKVDLDRAVAENKQLKEQVKWIEDQLKQVEQARSNAEAAVRELQHRLHESEGGRKKAEDEVARLKQEMQQMKKALDKAQSDLHNQVTTLTEQDTLIKTLQEQLGFERGLNKQRQETLKNLTGEFDSYKMERQTEILKHTHQLQSEYGEHLKTELQKLRGDFDNTLAHNRQQLTDLYEKKLMHSAEQGNRKDKALEQAHIELSNLRNRVDKMESERAKYNDEVAGLQRHIKDLQDQLRVVTNDYTNHLSARDSEIAQLRDEIDTILKDYQDLMDVKLKLDVEIEAYRTMLEGEEARLRMFNPNQSGGGGGGGQQYSSRTTPSSSLPPDPSHQLARPTVLAPRVPSAKSPTNVDYRVYTKTVHKTQQQSTTYTESDV